MRIFADYSASLISPTRFPAQVHLWPRVPAAIDIGLLNVVEPCMRLIEEYALISGPAFFEKHGDDCLLAVSSTLGYVATHLQVSIVRATECLLVCFETLAATKFLPLAPTLLEVAVDAEENTILAQRCLHAASRIYLSGVHVPPQSRAAFVHASISVLSHSKDWVSQSHRRVIAAAVARLASDPGIVRQAKDIESMPVEVAYNPMALSPGDARRNKVLHDDVLVMNSILA